MNARASPTKTIAVLAALMLSVAGLALADPIPGLHNTGQADAYVADPYYDLTAAPEDVPLTALVADGDLWPINNGPWLNNTDTSKWIGPYANLQSAPEGTYEYTLQFDLTGLIPSTVEITGQFATDNPGYIYVNDEYTEETNSDKSPVEDMFRTWTDFALNSSNSSFNSGLNTLMFQVENWPDGSGNPTGLRVEMTGTADVIPEPFSMAFLGSAFVGVVACRLRKRRKEAKK